MSPTGAFDVPVKSDEVDTLRKKIRDLEMELIEERKASVFAIMRPRGGAYYFCYTNKTIKLSSIYCHGKIV